MTPGAADLRDFKILLSSSDIRFDDHSKEQLFDGIYAEHTTNRPIDAFNNYYASAESGEPAAMFFLGRSFLYEYGTPQHIPNAVYWFQQARQRGSPYFRSLASRELARLRLSGFAHHLTLSAADYLLDAAELHNAAIPSLVDYLTIQEGLPVADQTVQNWIDRAADADNVSALYFRYPTSSPSQQTAIIDRLKDIRSVAANTALGDIFRDQGDVKNAYEFYAMSSQSDPYALAQAALLAINNPLELPAISAQDALDDVRSAAAVGDPAAIVALAESAVDLDVKYELLLTAQDNDPQRHYAEEIRRNKQEICRAGDISCPPLLISYITNRELVNEDSPQFSSRLSGGDQLHLGIIETAIAIPLHPHPSPLSTADYVFRAYCQQIQPQIMCDTSGIASITGDSRILPDNRTTEQFLSFLKDVAYDQGLKEVVVYIHGFNNSFDAAAERMAQMIYRGRIRALPILLSWPAGFKPLLFGNIRLRHRYNQDRTQAESSCRTLRGALLEVVTAFGSENVHIVAHSMGAYLVSLMASGCGSPQEIDAIKAKSLAYVAADIDVDWFRNHYTEFRDIAEHFTLYVTTNDAALRASQSIMNGGKRRLGTGGDGRFVADNAVTVDTTTVEFSPHSDVLNHAHVFNTPYARRDLSHLLNGAFEPELPRFLIPIGEGAYYVDDW